MIEIDEEKARVYQILSDIILKFILGIGALILLGYVVFKMINDGNSWNKAIYGGVASILSGCIYLPFRHYFPLTSGAAKPKTPAKRSVPK